MEEGACRDDARRVCLARRGTERDLWRRPAGVARMLVGRRHLRARRSDAVHRLHHADGARRRRRRAHSGGRPDRRARNARRHRPVAPHRRGALHRRTQRDLVARRPATLRPIGRHLRRRSVLYLRAARHDCRWRLARRRGNHRRRRRPGASGPLSGGRAPASLPLAMRSALRAQALATQSVRVAAAAPLRDEDVLEATRNVDSAVVEAWLRAVPRPVIVVRGPDEGAGAVAHTTTFDDSYGVPLGWGWGFFLPAGRNGTGHRDPRHASPPQPAGATVRLGKPRR